MTQRSLKAGPSTVWFGVATFVYIVAMLLGSYTLGFFDSDGKPISPSEWGDVLAGVFSPLAFLWLVYASLSQRAELELQRLELQQNNKTQDDQRAAMERQVEALSAQASLLEAQATATYEPIFVVRSIQGDLQVDSFLIVIVENLGGDILNVRPQPNVTVRNIRIGLENPPRPVRGNLIAHWPKTGKADFQIAVDEHGFRNEPDIWLTFQRLDYVNRQVSLALQYDSHSLEVKSSSSDAKRKSAPAPLL